MISGTRTARGEGDGQVSESTRDAGEVTAALTYAEQLAKIEPNNAELKALIETLRAKGQGKQQ